MDEVQEEEVSPLEPPWSKGTPSNPFEGKLGMTEGLADPTATPARYVIGSNNGAGRLPGPSVGDGTDRRDG